MNSNFRTRGEEKEKEIRISIDKILARGGTVDKVFSFLVLLLV